MKVKNRYGATREYTLKGDTMIVTGQSEFSRASNNESGAMFMFDFEGGPTFYLGDHIEYQGKKYIIKRITPKKDNVTSVELRVEELNNHKF